MRRSPTPTSTAAAGVRLGAVLAAIAAGALGIGVFVGSVTSDVTASPQPGASQSRTTPAPTVRVTLPPTTPPSVIVTVPDTLDATGASDMTAAIQAIVDDAPDGALIRFPAAGRYRLDGSLTVLGRTGLTIDGSGSTLVQPALGDDPGRGIWRIRESRATTLRDFRLEGANPDPGVFRQGFEWQHSVAVEGSDRTVLNRLVMDRPMGDCVYVAHGQRAWSSHVWVVDSTCRGAARQGIAIVGGRDVWVARSTFGTIGLSVLDLEPEAGGLIEQGAHAVVFSDNLVDGDYGGRMFNATGVGPMGDVVVERTRVRGARWGISAMVAPHTGSQRAVGIVFRDNAGEESVLARGHAVLHFADVDNLVVRGNVQRIDAAEAAIHLARVCGALVEGNELAPVRVVTRVAGECR